MSWVRVALTAVLLSEAPLGAAELVLDDSLGSLGCAEVRGAHVGLVVPQRGIVLLGTRPFPGGSEVGAVEGGRLVVEIPGFGSLELASAESAGRAPVWGLFDRSLTVGESDGCFGFGERRFSDVDDLKTYLHWWVREVLDRVPRTAGEPAPAVWLAGRPVTFEVVAEGWRPLELEIVEGSTSGFAPMEGGPTYYFQPFVLGRAGRLAAVRVWKKEGAYFGLGAAGDVAFVVIGPDEPVRVPTTPPMALRLTGIQTSVSFVD